MINPLAHQVSPIPFIRQVFVLIAAALFLAAWPSQRVAAQAWVPKPYTADDIGNWSTTTVTALEIRLNGFTGYTTTGVTADTIVDPTGYRSGKVSHPQHVVRLPNAIGADGQWHAYFAITHSGDCDPTQDVPITSGCSLADMGDGDGYWMVVELDADAFDLATDRIIDTPDSDGRYVFEEHFRATTPKGDWNHPAAMAAFGDLLLIVAQNWSTPFLLQGDTADAILIYDVSNPRAPEYIGKLDACYWKLASNCSDGGPGLDKIDTLGLAYFENGWYHLNVGKPGNFKNFYCVDVQDCFKPPFDNKWSQGPSVNQAGGQQGQIIHSREIYAESPGPGEPCYKQDGTLLGPGERDASCTPSGVRRAIYSFADHGSGQRYVQGSCWPYSDCSLLTYNEDPKYTKPFELIPGFSTLSQIANFLGVRNSADLDQFRRDAGIPLFNEIRYQYTDPTNFNNSGTVLSPGGDSENLAGSFRVRNKTYFTQLSGECQSGNGTYVDSNGEVLIYCVTERTSEFGGAFPTEQPRTCPENSAPAPLGESCNILYENRPNGAPSHGVIRITEPGGKQIIYRGRGLADVERLNEPPWGPGRNSDGSLKNPNAVDWKLALSTPGTEIRVLSGSWLYYEEENFGGPDSYDIWPDPNFYVINLGTVPRMRSLRVEPERGVALFDDPSYRGRMVSALRDVPDLARYCGGDETQCRALPVTICDSPGVLNPLWYELCTYPRTFWDKTSSALTKHSSWALYGSVNYGSGSAELFQPGFPRWGNIGSAGASFRELDRGSCIKPTKPAADPFDTSFPYGDTAPRLSWANVPGSGPSGFVNIYEFVIEKEDGAIVFNEKMASFSGFPQDLSRFSMIYPRNSNFPALDVGATYRWRFRAIDIDNDCYEEGPWSDYQFLTIPEPTFEIGLTPVTNDPLGRGTGSIDFAPGSAPPASDLDGNYFTEGSLVTLIATAAPDSEFVGWAGDAASCGTATQCQLTVIANLNVQAVFRPKPRLLRGPNHFTWGTVAVNPTGFDCSSGSAWACDAYATGTQVSMTAAAVPGESFFVRWAGDPDCTDDDDNDGNPLTSRVTLSENKACTAVFDRSNFLLEVRTATFGGSVSGTDDGGGVLTCEQGQTQGQVCSRQYPNGVEQIATLTATPDSGFRFVRWNGSDECQSAANGGGTNNPINVTVGSSDVFCRAVFLDVNALYTINVQKTGAGSSASTVTGVVTAPTPADLPDVDCSLPSCTTEVASTAVVQLTATPVRGARFDGWAGGSPVCEGQGANPVIEINMADVAQLAGDLNCRANFSAKILLVDGSADGSSSGPRVDYGSVFNTLKDVDVDMWSVRSPSSTGNPEGRSEPTAADLAPYSRVVWFTADASTSVAFSPPAGPSLAAEAALGEFLDGGGCLLLSSAEYAADRGLTSFAQSYLGISSVAQNIGTATAVNGTGLLPGFNGLGSSTLDYGTATGAALNPALSDAVVADGDPDTYTLLQYGDGATAGVGRDNGAYRTAFLSFPFLALPSGTARSEVMGTFLDYCLQIDEDDDFEVNDDGVSDAIRSDLDDQLATRLQGDVNLTDLKIVPGNEDWYRWETSAKGDTRFEILFSHASGDLNFDFYEGNRRDPIDTIQSTDDNEFRDFFTVPEMSGGSTNYYFMRVYGLEGAANSYTLRITSAFPDPDNDGISNYMDFDDDGDGMSDEFELSNGFDPLFAGDASQDADNDGFTNYEESIAGTNPRDSASVPAPPSNVAPLNFFIDEICQPGAPRSVCGFPGLPWLNLLLGDDQQP